MRKINGKVLDSWYMLSLLGVGFSLLLFPQFGKFWTYFLSGLIILGFIIRMEKRRKGQIYFHGSELVHSIIIPFFIWSFFTDFHMIIDFILVFFIWIPIFYSRFFKKIQGKIFKTE